MAWQIGVDVGGTFTDFLALDPAAGLFRVAKA
jgi:N-methylhydantoinase A/oxoprolinase/acetone carboxylase beta subunit